MRARIVAGDMLQSISKIDGSDCFYTVLRTDSVETVLEANDGLSGPCYVTTWSLINAMQRGTFALVERAA